MFILMSIEE